MLLVGGCSDAPFHTVYDGKNVVYAAKDSDSKHGMYEYWVDDGSDQGWTLRSNQEFNVGDKISIFKSN